MSKRTVGTVAVIPGIPGDRIGYTRVECPGCDQVADLRKRVDALERRLAAVVERFPSVGVREEAE